MGYPLPPYTAIITAQQRQVFERLGKSDSTSYIIYDQELGWTVGRNRISNDGMYVSNAHGIRSNRNYDPHPPEGVIRIAAFGDSFTDCVGVLNENCWTYYLEQSSDSLEVLNFGVRAYGTDQALLRYRRDGRQFTPDIVLIGFMIENIRRNVNRYRPFYEHNTGSLGVKPRFKLDETALVLLPNPIPSEQKLKDLIIEERVFETFGPNDYWFEKFSMAFNLNSLLFRSNLIRISWLIYEKSQRNIRRLYQSVDGEPFKITASLLKVFYEESLNDGAQQAVVVLFPAKSHLEAYRDQGKKFWQSILDFLDQNSIDYIDLTDELAQSQLVTFDDTGHYTTQANQEVKNIVSKWLKQILTTLTN